MRGIPAWRQRQIAAKEVERELRAVERMGVLFGLDDETGEPAVPAQWEGGDVDLYSARWFRDMLDGFEKVADSAQVPMYGPEGNEINRLKAITLAATRYLGRIRNVPEASAGFGPARAWVEMFLEAVLLMADEVKQPSGKYGAHLEINLRLICDLVDLARGHLRDVLGVVLEPKVDPFVAYGPKRPAPAAAAPVQSFGEDDF